jgi:hypothetical protein
MKDSPFGADDHASDACAAAPRAPPSAGNRKVLGAPKQLHTCRPATTVLPVKGNLRQRNKSGTRVMADRGPRPISIAVRKSNRSTRNVRLTSKVRTRKVSGKARCTRPVPLVATSSPSTTRADLRSLLTGNDCSGLLSRNCGTLTKSGTRVCSRSRSSSHTFCIFIS